MATPAGPRAGRELHDATPLAVVVLDGRGIDSRLVGGKAAALDRLISWGIAVPPTAVVTVEAYRELTSHARVTALLARLADGQRVPAAEVDAAFFDSGMSAGLRDQVASAARLIAGGRPIAVRSSATVEDLERSSFAGQYRSVLGVDADDPDAVVHAVLLVFASLLHPAPCAYRAAIGIPGDHEGMAVVLMPIVPAIRAGVLFTQDPGSEPGTVRIEEVDGLAESLVSGARTPRVVIVERTTPRDDLTRELADLLVIAHDIERRAGLPQDIEWAWDGSQIWIVQTRPITVPTSGEHDEFDDDATSLDGAELTTAGIGEMLPGVLPPLVWELCSYIVEEAFRSMLDDLGVMPDDLVASRALIRRVRGRAALDAGRLTGAMVAIPGADERIRENYFGVERSVADGGGTPRRRFASTLHAARSSAARRRASFSADVVIRAAVEIAAGAEEIVRWPTSRLLAYHVALVDLAARGMAAELTVAADAGAIHAGLQSVLAHHLPQAAARHHAIAVTLPTDFATPAPNASAAVFAGPTWAAIGLDTAPAVTPMAADRNRPLDELMKELEASPGWPESGWRRWLRRRRVERLATEASRQLDRRERAKGAILLLGGEVRRIHLELGRRMVEMNGLTGAEDIDLLSLDEIRRALAGRATVAAATVERRRRWLDRHAAEGPIPVRFTGIPGPIDDTAVPAADRLVGWATSGGRFIGRARRVDGPDGSIRRDEVLVATTTDPSWSPLLMSCGAMVIERGGPLSHAAILAREFAVPAVFNVPGAAAFLDGRQVLVDGDAGVVTVLNHREAP